MKKTLVLLVASLALCSSAFARPCRDYYRRPYRRPCVVEHHYHHHKSHTWHREDWGKFAAGAAIGWLVNEASSAPSRHEVVYAPPQPVYQPTYAPEPAYVPAYRHPVYQTVTRTPSSTIVATPYAPAIRTIAPTVNVINQSTTVQVVQPTQVIQRYCY